MGFVLRLARGRCIEGSVRVYRGSLDQQPAVIGLVSTLLAPQGGEHAGWHGRGGLSRDPDAVGAKPTKHGCFVSRDIRSDL